MRVALLALLFLAPLSFAQSTPDGIDATLTLAPGAAPTIQAPAGLVRANETAEARWTFDLSLAREYTTFEVRAAGFGLDRARQLVPTLALPETDLPLFEEFPNERIWEVDAPARVFRTLGSGDDVILRLGIPGPTNVTLVLALDRIAPKGTIDDPTEISPIGWYQETHTDELALANLQVRAVGATEWIDNPTPVFHFRQRFPVQGLQADREHEARIIFTDWAQNNVTSPIYIVRTAAMPVAPQPIVRALSPAPNSTVLDGANVVIRASVRSNESNVTAEGVRVFFDLKEVTPEVAFDGLEVRYTPPAKLEPGLHRVAVEVRNLAGGEAQARWSFEVEAPRKEPLPPILAIGALVVAVALAARPRRP